MTVMESQGLTIGETAERVGLSADTLRYYERIGLIDSVGRSVSGYRVFRERDLAWLETVLRLRDTGMSVRDMLDYAALWRAGDDTAAERRAILAAHRRTMLAKVAQLQDTIAFVEGKIERYDGIVAGRQASASATGTACC